MGNWGFLAFLLILFGSHLARANEVLRPHSHEDFDPEALSFEWAVRVRGVKVAWADYDRLKRDFPMLQTWSDERIDAYLVEQAGYIGVAQLLLAGIRITDVPVDWSDLKPLYRQSEWIRSANLELTTPAGEVLGMMDAKGIGYGANGASSVRSQIIDFWGIQKNTNLSEEDRNTKLDAFRLKSHNNGAVSGGEATVEVSRQQARQKSFELRGLPLETVEAYAILHYPHRILKENGKLDPAALLLRQASFRRVHITSSVADIYKDLHGSSQSTASGTKVDEGGVLITDSNAARAHLGEVDLAEVIASLEKDQSIDPQQAKDWKDAHDTYAYYAENPSPERRQAFTRHFKDMLGDLAWKTPSTEAKQSRAQFKERLSGLLDFLRSRGASLDQLLKAAYLSYNRALLQSPSMSASRRGPWLHMEVIARDLSGARSLKLIEEWLKSEHPHLRALANQALDHRAKTPSASETEADTKTSVQKLTSAFSSAESKTLKFSILRSLGASKLWETRVFLERVKRSDPDESVRKAAQQALLQAKRHVYDPVLLHEAVLDLMKYQHGDIAQGVDSQRMVSFKYAELWADQIDTPDLLRLIEKQEFNHLQKFAFAKQLIARKALTKEELLNRLFPNPDPKTDFLTHAVLGSLPAFSSDAERLKFFSQSDWGSFVLQYKQALTCAQALSSTPRFFRTSD